MLAVGFACSTVSAASAATVTDVKVSNGANGTLQVEVGANGAVKHRAKTLSKPQKLIVVDVFPAVLGQNVRTSFDVNQGLVEKVRVKQYNDNTVRVYVDVITLPEFKVMTADGSKGLTLAVSTAQMAEGKATSAPSTSEEDTEVATQPTAPATQPRVAQSSPRPRTAPRQVSNNGINMSGAGDAPVSALRPRRAPKKAPAPKQRLVTLDFVNADLVYVIKVLAKEMNRNVFVGPTVDGSVTVTLKNVPVEGALALILKMQENEYDYKVLKNTIVVAAPEKLSEIPDDILDDSKVKEPLLPEFTIRQEILLEKAPAAKVMEFLEGQYDRVKFTAHPTMNGFYVVGSREDVLQIKREVPNLDRVPEPPPPPLREFLTVKYGDINEVRTLLSTLVPDVQYNVDTRLNLIIAEGSPGAIDQVKELLAEIDRPLDQVMIDVKVVDITENGRKQLGVSWGASGAPGTVITTFTEGVTGQRLERNNNAGGAILNPGALTQIQSFAAIGISEFARSPLILEASIQFLVTQGEAKVLASPRVATRSGRDALIHIGDKFPIVYFDPRAGQFQVQYVDIGIKLDVKPEIKADGFVLVDLRPEVSTLVELVNNQYPRTAVRTVNTSMRVKDGDTIIIGGLIQEQDLQSVTKVPLLGDLPIIGTLFRQTSVTKTRNEVVMMLTPSVMR
ncbi:MAG: secretin N-terminal domain-containing protein [Vulcanimicrobiota bacterium]